MEPTRPAKGTPCSSVFPAPAPASIPVPGPDLVPRVEQIGRIVGTRTSSSANGVAGGISRDTSGSSTSSSTSSTKGKKNKRKSAASTATKRRRRASDSGHYPPMPAPADCPWTRNQGERSPVLDHKRTSRHPGGVVILTKLDWCFHPRSGASENDSALGMVPPRLRGGGRGRDFFILWFPGGKARRCWRGSVVVIASSCGRAADVRRW